MTVNVDLGDGFTATRALISGGERVLRDDSNVIIGINSPVALFKNQTELDAGNSCCEMVAKIINVAGYDASITWLEAKITTILS